MDGSAEMPPALLALRGVCKRFGAVPALADVGFNLAAGEVLAILGPSGCGKTTLLRILAGFEAPDEGTVALDGRDILPVPPWRRPVNMMFQSYALFPHLTVERNVAFGLRQERLPRAEIAARVAEVLALVRLAGLERRMPHALSGGQRQRVALARALAKKPRLLLLDEPMAALDRRLREETQVELLALQRRLGLACILVTHDQAEAMALAHRIAVMEKGRIVQLGSPAEIYRRPANRFVASFIGDASLIAVRVLGQEGDMLAVVAAANDTLHLSVPASTAPALPPGGMGWVMLRPEAVQVAPASRTEDAGALAARITHASYAGALMQYRLALAEGIELRASRPAASGDAPPLAPGDAVRVSWPPGAAVLLAE